MGEKLGRLVLDVRIPILPDTQPPKTVSRRGRIALSKLTAKHRQLCHFAYRPHRPSQPLLRARVIFTRLSAREPDYGNLVASFKHVQDQLTARIPGGSRVIVDDSPKHLEAEYLWEYASGRDQGVRVQVWDLTAPTDGEWFHD